MLPDRGDTRCAHPVGISEGEPPDDALAPAALWQQQVLVKV
jgi:hypothetical protein